MLFSKVAKLFSEIESVSSGNVMRQTLADFFKKSSVEDLQQVCYLLLGQIDARYKDIKLGFAGQSALHAVKDAYNVDIKRVKEYRRKEGDLGEAAKLLAKKKRASLRVNSVISELRAIKDVSGSGSQQKKKDILIHLLRKASPEEAKYIIRIILGTLRLGAGKNAILDGLSIAFTGSKDAKKELEQAYTTSNDIGQVAKAAAKGMKGVKKLGLSFGRPISMMLAQRVKVIEDIPKKMHFPLVAEEKYDGARVQVHHKGDKIVLYSRRLENITNQYPDIVQAMQKAIPKKDYIVEGEIVAVKGNKLLPFQLLMQRKRKTHIEKYAKDIPVTCFLFDLLYEGEKSYMDETYPKRRAHLKSIFKKTKHIELARQEICKTIKQINAFFKASLKRGCEGIICKSMRKDSYYRSGARAWQWIKWKKEYVKGMRDTFDVAVIGMYYGKGKRKGMFGSLLCAVYNKTTKKFESTTKVGTGFTKKMNASLTRKLMRLKRVKKPSQVEIGNSPIPDTWIFPDIVIEIEGAEITKSPTHACGYAIRFPRFLHIRDDKSARQATTVRELK